jgi:hypothetical protein
VQGVELALNCQVTDPAVLLNPHEESLLHSGSLLVNFNGSSIMRYAECGCRLTDRSGTGRDPLPIRSW